MQLVEDWAVSTGNNTFVYRQEAGSTKTQEQNGNEWNCSVCSICCIPFHSVPFQVLVLPASSNL